MLFLKRKQQVNNSLQTTKLKLTSYMHYAQVKMSVKKRFYKKKKIGYEKFASRGFESGPSESVRTKC